ncbi:hypothetical protein L198_05685 [Cryptococcus wingfieldii CBS 7118]|uniref:Uncharacterized protein n=1 Tax=Cryptococcus wingfieldii CBS 7118 TaxID=1295528 RepID=A0A1E3ITQ7_9TREE|nr:hypothetical protein L198_05685 [Cryptococcus wingfieldii CBS 7118]ODN92013.1 hypothetical protein L198_05685 [Cryptococcus wingfieldii CBS 7118]
MSAHPKKRYYPPQPSRGEDRDATRHTTYSTRKVAIQGPPALRTAKSCPYISPADRSNLKKKGKGSMSWRGPYSGSAGAAANASAQERPGGPPPWLQRKTDSSSATPFDSVGSPRFAASHKPLGAQAGGSHWKKKVPNCPAAMASPPVPAAQPSRVQWAARAPPTQPRSLLDSNSPVSPSTFPPIMAKAPSPNSVGQPSSNMGKTQSSQPVAPHDHISTNFSHSFHQNPQPSSYQLSLDAYISMPALSAANSPSPPSPPSRPPALQQWFEARRRVSTDDGQSDVLQPKSSEISNIDKHQEGSSQDVTGGRSGLGLENASTSQNVEMDDEERDVKPSAEALEKALEQAVPRVKEEDRLEGCLALTRGQLPKDVWSPNPSIRRGTRGKIREQQEKELTKMGRKLVKSRWMSDGVAHDWKLVKQISLVEDQCCQIVKDDIAVTIPGLSAMDPSGAMDVNAVSLETGSGQQETETQVDGSGRHSSRRNVMALAVSAAATQPAPVSGLPMSRESSRDKRESENDVATMVSPTQTPIAVIIPSETTTSTSNRVPPSSIPAKPVTEAPASIESTSFNLPKPPSSSNPSRAINPTTNPSVKPNTKPEAKWGPAIIGRPPKSGAIDRIYKYELEIPPYIQITAAGKFTAQFQTWKLKHRDDMSGQSSRGCPSREVFLNHDGPNKCKSLQVRVVPIDMQDPSSWPLSMFPDIVEYVIPDHVKPRHVEVNPRSALFRTWEKTCMDMASNPDQWGRPTRWVKSMFCPSMSKGSLRVRWRGKTATEIASYEGAPIVLPGKGDHKDKSLRDREIEMVKEREQGKVKDKGKAIHSDSQPEKRLRSELMDDQDSSRKKSRRASESNGEREWDKGKKEGVYFDEGPRSRRREKEKERGTKQSGGGRGKEKETSRERDSGWSGMDAGKAKETEKEKEKERVGHESPSSEPPFASQTFPKLTTSFPPEASFFDDGPFPQAGIPATPVNGTSSSPSAYAPALPPAMAMVRQPVATTSLIAEHSGSSIAGVSMSIPSTVAAGHETPQTPTNPHPSVSMARPAPMPVLGSSTHSTPAISSPLLEELALGVRQKMNEIQTWTQMLNDFPDMADPMRGQIDRTQTEIFRLYAKMGQEKRRLMTGE